MDLQLISNLKARYVRFVDARSWAELERLLVDDFAFDGDRASRGAQVFVKHVAEQLADATTVHHLHIPEIELRSSSMASAVWPFADIIDQRRDGIGLVRRGFGHYHDDYIKVDGHWRISAMRITRVRVECETFQPDGSKESRLFLAQEELVAWMAAR